VAGVLAKKLWRELFGAARLLATVAGIVTVGVCCYVSLASVYLNLTQAKRDYYRRCRMAHFTIQVKKAPISVLEAAETLPGLDRLRPRIQFYALVDLPQSVLPLNGLIISMPEQRRPVINDIVLVRGSYFTGRSDQEVIINDAFARKHGLMPGDSIHVVLNRRRYKLTIVGTAISSEFTYLIGPGQIVPDPEHFGVFYLKRPFVEDVFQFQGAFNQLLGRMNKHAQDRVDLVLRQLETLLEPYGVFDSMPLRNQPSNWILSNELRGLFVFTVILPVFFLGVAALVLNILMVRMAEQQRVAMGTLKAIGYSDTTLVVHFILFGVVVGLIGGVAGCVSGKWLADKMTDIYRQFFEFPRLVHGFHLHLYLSGIAISVGCAVLGAYRGARLVLRLSPAEAMRPVPPQPVTYVPVEKLKILWASCDCIWRMALRNIMRNRRRSAVGVLAVATSASLLVAGFLMQAAMYFLVDFQYRWVLRSDVDLTFRRELSPDAASELRHLPAVDRVEPLFVVPCRLSNGVHRKRAAITGLMPGARLTIPCDRTGRRVPVPEIGLTMGKALADILHVQPGDYVEMQPIKGLRKKLLVPVVYIADGYLGLSAYANAAYLNRLVGEEATVTGAQLLLDPRPERRAALFKQLKQMANIESVNLRSIVERNLVDTLIEANRLVTGAITLFAAILFLGSTLNASLINLSERQREVATLLALGYEPSEVGALFFRENLVITLAGTAAGMPLGYLLTHSVAQIYNTELFRMPVVAPAWVWIGTAGCAVLFLWAAQWVIQTTINRTDWLQRLRVKE